MFSQIKFEEPLFLFHQTLRKDSKEILQGILYISYTLPMVLLVNLKHKYNYAKVWSIWIKEIPDGYYFNVPKLERC